MYVGKANGPIVGPYFDEEALLKKQEWDFFYIWPPEGAGSSPLLFVPSRQLKFLLRTINAAHQLSLNIPGGPTSAKFCIEFGMFGTPRPRYLGRARDAAELFKLQDTMPLPDNKELLDVTGMALMEYTELLRATRVSIMAAPKQKKKSHKVRRVVTRKAWGRAAKRVQRYLGLREKLSTGSSLSTSLVRLDVHSPAPFKAEDFVVFICFDVETYEKNHNIVTEIGFAILDTMDLVGIPPGENGEHWSKLIQARHLRIKEYSWVVNMEYIKGCPDNFDFGQSEFVPLKGVREVIQKIFTNDTSLVQEEPDDPENRRIVLVGHDIKQDIAHLQKLDVDVYALPNLLDVVDNQSLQQHLRAMRNPQKLESVLTDFGILSRHLHNAGNDAVYTLQSLLALAIRKSKQKVVEGDAKNKERDEGWSTGGEESDGGAPTWRMDSRSHT
ncbi:QDE-2-interacting protein [Pleurostoma richardsiae]|uniref:QDE-2-interacting protein n=1 Tax=Pleurostoma richardsiae TaxID=41990 RepID=A0AA38VNB4_9PEZI|nr:QDE-2-interacting protein [Pleurostoma richardsiae]